MSLHIVFMNANMMTAPNRTNAQSEMITLLKVEFSKREMKYPGYSLRRFSTKLGLAAPVLSEIMSGKRSITQATAVKILAALAIDPEKANKLLNQIKQTKKHKLTRLLNETHHSTSFSLLSNSEFDMISDWWYFAILSLAETKGCSSDEEKIAKRLGITTRQAKTALDLFIEKKIIEVRGGFLKTTGHQLTTTTDISDVAIRKNHHEGLIKAAEALDNVPLEIREFGAMTMAIDTTKIPEAKRMIVNFRKELAHFLEQDNQTEVYRLQVQFFPLTKQIRN